MAGFSGTPLIQKLGIKEGMTVGILNMPNYSDLDLGDLPPDLHIHRGGFPADIFIVFAERSDEPERGFRPRSPLYRRIGRSGCSGPRRAPAWIPT